MGPVVAAAAVVSAVVGVYGAAQSASAAKKQESLQKRRQKLEAIERETAAAREKARIARETRLKRASVLNNATIQGAGQSSAAQGIDVGLQSAQKGAQGYVDVQNLLAKESAKITTKQIELNSSNLQKKAFAEGVDSVVSGVGTYAYYGGFD